MPGNGKRRPPLSVEQRQRFAGLIVLDRLVTQPGAYAVGLLDRPEDQALEPVLNYLIEQALAEIGPDDKYAPTEKGRQVYQKLLEQRQAYLRHLSIYSHVDLGTGDFADPDKDLLEDQRWSDLRVAVAEHKGIDPYHMVFLAMLSDGQFFEGRDWQFDLALDSGFFKELEETVAAQLSVEDLAYDVQDEPGQTEHVSGETVIEDVIQHGTELAREREQRQASLLEEDARRQAQAEDPYAPGSVWYEVLW